jgi:hypothetical protein
METVEKRFVVKYFRMTSWRSKKIRKELITTLGTLLTGCSKSKYDRRSSETAIYHTGIFIAPGDSP